MQNSTKTVVNGTSELTKQVNSGAPPTTTLPRGILGRGGVPLPAGARLSSSLRVPRDLSLSGSGAVPNVAVALKKSVFTPNLSTKRTPKEGRSTFDTEFSSNSGRGGGRGRGKRERGRGSGPGRGRGRAANVLQLHGAFEGGLPPALRPKTERGWSGGGGSEGGSGGTPALERPKYIPAVKENKEAEQAKLDRLLRDDFIDDPDGSDTLYPLMVPLRAARGDAITSTGSSVKREIKPEVKQEPEVCIKQEPDVDIKQEPDVDIKREDDLDTSVAVKSSVKQEVSDDVGSEISSIGDMLLLHRKQPDREHRMFVVQFPQAFPTHGAAPPPAPPAPSGADQKRKNTAAATAGPSAAKQVKPSCQLRDLPEGRLGTLRIYKSGAARLFLGGGSTSTGSEGAPIEMELATSDAFHQDAALVDPTTNSIVSIGNIDAKLIGRPVQPNPSAATAGSLVLSLPNRPNR